MNDKRFEDAINELGKEKFEFAMRQEEIIERIKNSSPRVRDIKTVGDVSLIYTNTDNWAQQAVQFRFSCIKGNDGMVNYMTADTNMDEELFYGEPNEVRILEHNEVSGRPEGVIGYILAKLERYFPEDNMNEETGEYVITLDF